MQNAYLLTLKLKASNHSYLAYNSLCNFQLFIKHLTVSKFCFSYIKGICFSLLARENFFAHNRAFGYTENLHSYSLNESLLILYEFALPMWRVKKKWHQAFFVVKKDLTVLLWMAPPRKMGKLVLKIQSAWWFRQEVL